LTGRRPTASVRPAPTFAWAELWPVMGAKAAIGAMFAIFLFAHLVAGWLHVPALTGFGFAAGSAVAAGRTRRQGLLLVATTPPLIFLAAVTCGELIALHAGHVAVSVGPVLAGIFLTLSSAAPWLFCGLAGALVIAMVRGLPGCVRQLRAELRGKVTPRDYEPRSADSVRGR
jgi:uncharacterized protein DUF6542